MNRTTWRVSWTCAAALAAAVTLWPSDGAAQSRQSDRSDRSSRSSRTDRSDRSSRSSRNAAEAYAASTQPTTRFAGGPVTRPTNFTDGYRVLLDRNIFNRSRVALSSRSSSTTTSPVSSQPRGGLVLVGVVREGKQYVAFIEDTRTNATTRMSVGDAVGTEGGKITAADLDHIEVTKDGKPVRVELGNTIQGTAPTFGFGGGSSGGSSTASGFGSSPSTGSTSGGGGGSDDILERLRQRRMQETKR